MIRARHSRIRHFPNSPGLATGLIGLAVLLVAFFLWPRRLDGDATYAFHLFLGLVAVTMVAVDALIGRSWAQPEAGLGPLSRLVRGRSDTARLLRKAAGTVATLALVLLIYRSAEMYQEPFYQRFVGPVMANWPLILGVVLAYVAAMDRLLLDPHDHLDEFGRFVLSLGAEGDRGAVMDWLLGWLVKLFFLPLMYGYAVDDWTFFYTVPVYITDFRSFFEFGYRFLFFVDVVLAVIGYALSLRLLNAHIRWPERTFRGWVICVMCYMPFWQVLGRNWFDAGDSIVWGSVFADMPVVYVLWGSVILLCLVVYVLATASFGLRFSNITYRGTVVRGPYALTKHPAYVFKVTTMWMIQLPFLAASPGEALANTTALAGITAIYAARAWHEERCCGHAREYRLYSRYMRRHGPVARGLRALTSRGTPAPRFGVTTPAE